MTAVTASTAGDVARVLTAARDALAGATDASTATAAAATCRLAAARLAASVGYAEAAELLDEAVTVLDRFDAVDGRTATLVDRAEALVWAGRLGEGRDAAFTAVVTAERDGDRAGAARAALALSGMWANELRTPDVRARAAGHQRRALAALGDDEPALALRLRARLAATRAFYDDLPAAELRAVVTDARAQGDARALGEALSLLCHVLLGPDDAAERLDTADEMIAVCAGADEPTLAVLGLFWRAVHLHLAGDPRADRALAALRARDDAVPCLAITYQRRVLDVMAAIRTGRLDEAEREAETCLAQGDAIGDADALSYYGAHLLAIRWFQGRDAELLELFAALASSPSLDDVDHTFEAAHAALAARSGRLDVAAALLDRLRRLDLRSLPRRSTWAATLMGVVVAAAAVGDTELAELSVELLAPYGHLPVMPSFAVVDLGVADHFVGLALRSLGRWDEAVDRLERAVATATRLGNLPGACTARADLAETLHARGGEGDETRAVAAYHRAVADAHALGLDVLGDRWRERLAAVGTTAGPAELELHRQGRTWRLRRAGTEVALAPMVGLSYLAELLASPGRDIPAAVLAGGPEAPLDRVAQPIVDDDARRAYLGRVRELTERIDRLRERGDAGRLRAAQDELDSLVATLRATARAGHTRRFAGADERARTAVRKAIVRAIDAIGELDPWAAVHLRSCVTTGTTCVYRPTGQDTSGN